ncbi:MAG: ATP-binding cassette domain-containing protein, partial [Rhizobiaceae bacterium]
KMFGMATDPGGKLLRQSSAFVTGTSGVYPSLSCDENLRVFCILQGGKPERIDAALAYVGLAALRHRKAATLSTGMRQRLALAAAFLLDVPLLLLDEPTNGLDPDGIDDVNQILRRYRDDHGATIVISSHQLEQLSNIYDDVILVREGRIVSHQSGGGPASIFLRSPSIGLVETALRALDVSYVKQDQYWKIDVVDGEETDLFAARVVRALTQRGVDVCEVSSRGSALAQVYHGDPGS